MCEDIKKKNCVYITYDKNLKEYLRRNNISNLVYGINPKTNGMFWVFERTALLNELLKKWFRN